METSLDFPVYSIKAVAYMSGVTEPTLRAWEKRYSIINPKRTESGHRRYTRRDILHVIWLKKRLDEGMSISQAAALIQTHPEQAILNSAQSASKEKLLNGSNPETSHTNLPDNTFINEVRSIPAFFNNLLESFEAFDELRAEQLISEAFGLYSTEKVLSEIIQPVMEEIGERWARGELTVANEHFSSNLIRAKLNSVINSLPLRQTGPLVVTACGPEEYHELGILMTTLYLRRQGWRVIYLGQNVPALDLEKDLIRLKPDLVVFSVSRAETAEFLVNLILPVIEEVSSRWLPNLKFAYGGRPFIMEPALHSFYHNHTYFGDSAEQSSKVIQKILG